MAALTKPYEISIWEDRLTFVTDRGEYEERLPDQAGIVQGQYYKECKLAIIGSDTMSAPTRVFNPVLKQNINGTSTLSFSIFSHYRDEESGELLDNPLKSLLVNERKVKLRYGKPNECEWYDFLIKDVSEDSESKIYTYTAKDLFANELSKSGFNLEFDKDLENNMGTVTTLAKRILKESDWKVDESPLVLKETKEDPLYKITLAQDIEASNIKDEKNKISIPRNKEIYCFYSSIENKEAFLQFLYVPDGDYKYDDRNVLINEDCNYLVEVTYSENGLPMYNNATLMQESVLSVYGTFRGNKYVRKQLTCYDSTIDKYVNVYTDGVREIYGYAEHDYLSTNAIKSYITNPDNFTSTIGWSGGIYGTSGDLNYQPDLDLAMVPDIRDVGVSYQGICESFLKFEKTNGNQVLYNSGLIDFRNEYDSFTEGEEYVFRIKYGHLQNSIPASVVGSNIGLTFKIIPYELENGIYKPIDGGRPLFSGRISPKGSTINGYQTSISKCAYSLSYRDLVAPGFQLGLFLTFDNDGTFYVKQVQFFQKRLDENGQICEPNIPIKALVKTKYCYYLPNKDYKEEADIKFLYKGETPNQAYKPVYNNNGFEKVRMITEKESNRFNLIQTLCETFQCWVKFKVEHNSNGQILLGKDSPHWNEWDEVRKKEEQYRQQKWVQFYEGITKEKYCGFIYGINLKSIKRTVESDAIVSKIIVKNNSNEFAKDGFCNIARADENYAKENFILDFSYYIRQGLLNGNVVNNDLYLYSPDLGYIGYYKQLREKNTQLQKIIDEQSLLAIDILKLTSQDASLKNQLDKTSEELRQTYSLIKQLTGKTYKELQDNPSDPWCKDQLVISYFNNIQALKQSITFQTKLEQSVKIQLDNGNKTYNENQSNFRKLLEEKEKLNATFYKKYSSFIQEGSWISEDYMDDNLYYLDAEYNLHTASQPKVSYTINVLELSSLEGYENYIFHLGDKTFMEDTEFFGWNYNGELRTPYKEEIVVTEISTFLDAPEQNTITVQNYKTQFEDLFQRITATAQSIEFNSGSYNRATSIVQNDGSIKIDSLQNTIANNSVVLQNAKNQSVIWDTSGITTTSLTSPNEIVRIVSGGIFLSNDGGLTWNTGITGKGINANCITAGQINTNEINLISGAFPCFKWDASGISAYSFDWNAEKNAIQNFNYDKFVRFDQYGLYAIKDKGGPENRFNANVSDEDGTIGEEKIIKNSDFSLTWSGFQIKTNHKDGGSINITSQNDFEVKSDPSHTRVKIGLIGTSQGHEVYGIQMIDQNGTIVLNQNSEGKLWLRDSMTIGQNVSTVAIGFLKESKIGQDGVTYHQVINAKDNFIVYEDGSLYAKDGYFEGSGKFTGEITANSGTIGGLSIDSIVAKTYEVVIESNSGIFFKNGIGTKILTAKLYQGKEEVSSEKLTYKWYKQGTIIPAETGRTLTVNASEVVSENDNATYTCIIAMKE